MGECVLIHGECIHGMPNVTTGSISDAKQRASGVPRQHGTAPGVTALWVRRTVLPNADPVKRLHISCNSLFQNMAPLMNTKNRNASSENLFFTLVLSGGHSGPRVKSSHHQRARQKMDVSHSDQGRTPISSGRISPFAARPSQSATTDSCLFHLTFSQIQ